MPVSLALTVTGPDKPGLIEALSSTLATHGANWQESRMATLGGQFAGIVLTSVPDDQLEPLQAALDGLCAQGLTVSTSKSLAVQPLADQRTVRLEMTGQDRPGILREISHALVTCGISIEELETGCLSASWSGEVIFRATAELWVPADLPTERLREVLESLGNELMVDITLDEITSA